MKFNKLMGYLGVVCSLSFAAVETTSKVDLAKAKSEVQFVANGKVPGFTVKGNVKADSPLSGQMKIAGCKVTGEAKVKLDSLDTGIELRTRHMKEKYLETGKFPEATLSFKNLVLPEGWEKNPEFEFSGLVFKEELVLHGKKKTVEGTVSGKKKGDQVELNFEFPLALTDYDIAVPSFAGVELTKDVQVTVQVAGALGK